MKQLSFKNIFSKKKESHHYHKPVSHHTRWFIVFVASVVLSMLAGALGLFTFLAISENTISRTDASLPLSTDVDQDRLRKIINHFEEREIKQAEVVESGSGFKDPSTASSISVSQ